MSKHREKPKFPQQQTRQVPMTTMTTMPLKLLRCHDLGGSEFIVNLDHVVTAEWLTKIPDNANPQVPLILPKPIVSLTLNVLRQGTTICRYIHPTDSKWIWAMLEGFAVCGIGQPPPPPGGNGKNDSEIVT